MMTTAERNAKIYKMRQQGVSYKVISKALGIPQGTARRVVYHEKRKRQPDIQPTAIVQRPENETTDFQLWERSLATLAKRKRWLTVMHLSDIHFPYHDETALRLTYKLIAAMQPDVIVVGSDAFDLPTISRFEPDRDLDVDDWLHQLTPYWRSFIASLRNAAPDALLPFILGNHDARALAEIKRLSVRRVVMQHFIDMVRADDAVLWLGDTQEVEIGNLTVTHGWKTTRHTAAATLQAYQHQRNVIAGHTHRPDFYTVRGAAYSVACAVGGCLCQLTPHYQIGRKHTDWQHGTVIATVDMQSHAASLNNIVYQPADGKLWTSIGTQVIEVTS